MLNLRGRAALPEVDFPFSQEQYPRAGATPGSVGGFVLPAGDLPCRSESLLTTERTIGDYISII